MKQRDFLKNGVVAATSTLADWEPESLVKVRGHPSHGQGVNFAPQASTRRHCLDGCRVRSNPVIVLHKRLMIVSVESSGFHRVV